MGRLKVPISDIKCVIYGTMEEMRSIGKKSRRKEALNMFMAKKTKSTNKFLKRFGYRLNV